MNNEPVEIPVDSLATHANSYASAHGVQVERQGENGGSYYECAPMSLLPNAYPEKAFENAKSLATSFNELVERISQDPDFLQQTLGGDVSEADPYTAKLLKLYNEIYVKGGANSNVAHTADRLGIHRSDYMLHAPSEGAEYELKQVELNTIAASFAGLSANVASLHRHLTSRFQKDTSTFLKSNQKVVVQHDKEAAGVPVNPALERLPKAMKLAHERYIERFGSKDTVALFVVQDGETNTVDQRMLEFRLWNDHQVPVIRMGLKRIATELSVDPDTGALRFTDSGKEVSLVYFRAGYAPTDYPGGYDGIEWKARSMIEQTRAVKAPSLGYHLAGTKKVQQELARPGVLERFFPKPEEKGKVEHMRSAFAGLYSLGDDATAEDLGAVHDVLDNGREGYYVLKPQREGGGYNFYGSNLANKLRENVSSKDGSIQLGKELAEYILMQRLFPPQQRAVLLRNGKVEGSGDSISELGCFGTLLVSSDGKLVHNEYGGFLLRTKFSNVDEGGVASGFATLSSPYLC